MDGCAEGLSRLQQASELLLASALNCPIGARSPESGKEQSLHSVSELYERYTRLQRQVHQKTVQLEAEKSLNQNPVQSSEELILSISELEEELLKVSTDKMLQNQLMKKLQLGAVSHNILSTEDGNPSIYHKKIEDLARHHLQLSVEIREELKELSTLSHHLDKLKRRNLDKVEVVRRLQKGLEDIRNAKLKLCGSRITSTTVKKYRDEVQDSIKQIILVRNMFQGLIVGSGIPWADDKELTETLLALGDSLDNQIANYAQNTEK